MKTRKIVTLALLLIVVLFSGCAYRYYLGMHGPSIKDFPDTHLDVKTDDQCLQCHDPDKPTDAPPTSVMSSLRCCKITPQFWFAARHD